MNALPKIDAVAFWLEGVLAPSLADLCAVICFAKPIASVDIQPRLGLRAAIEQLALGHLQPLDFCQQVVEISGVALTAPALEAALLERLRLRDDVSPILADLPAPVARWLVTGLPRRWIEATVSQPLQKLIPPDRWLFTAEIGLPRLIPDLFAAWIDRAGLPMSACMIVDAITPNAVEAIRHGLHSAIYVDARRLRREFVLRRMLPAPPGFVFPRPVDAEPKEAPR
ncbi:MAG: hypothetical protein JNM70_06400 [Anaerolineae bacterium]|nr:hypothetical protein [Anaerolineae bacterium]